MKQYIFCPKKPKNGTAIVENGAVAFGTQSDDPSFVPVEVYMEQLRVMGLAPVLVDSIDEVPRECQC